jgi:hypothetical protein
MVRLWFLLLWANRVFARIVEVEISGMLMLFGGTEDVDEVSFWHNYLWWIVLIYGFS